MHQQQAWETAEALRTGARPKTTSGQQATTQVTWSDRQTTGQRTGTPRTEDCRDVVMTTAVSCRIDIVPAACTFRPLIVPTGSPVSVSEAAVTDFPFINPAPIHYVLAFPNDPQSEENRAIAVSVTRVRSKRSWKDKEEEKSTEPPSRHLLASTAADTTVSPVSKSLQEPAAAAACSQDLNLSDKNLDPDRTVNF